jgi:two-component system, OmpR family, phosphate regulon sensor histidine kinase PhoR
MSGGLDTKLRNKSLIIRILFFYVLIMVVSLLLVFFFFFKDLENDSIKKIAVNLNNYCSLIDENIIRYLSEDTGMEFQNYVKSKSLSLDARITVIDVTGKVVSESEENPEYMENHSDRPEVRNALNGKSNYVIRFSNTLKKSMMYYAYPLVNNGNTVGVIRLSVYIDDVDRMVNLLQLKYILVTFFMLLVSTFAILMIYFNFKREIGVFSRISYNVSEGNLDVKLPENESYEIRELSASYRKMILKINQLISELMHEKEEIESIISSIREAVCVVDGKGMIIRYNNGFESLFGTNNYEGKYFWEIIRNNEVIDQIKNLREKSGKMREIEIGDRIFLCSINDLKIKEEIVIILYDITELTNFNRVKKDLVINVSHELGTPLTAIKGYVETLLDEEQDAQKLNYLNIIFQHTERLNNIVKDLLLLSKLEQDYKLEKYERVNLKNIISVILPLFNEKLKEKNINFVINAGEEMYPVSGDSFKLEQMLINIVDNAVKYTDQGEIRINLENLEDTVRVEIVDTGIGIPDQDKSRVFERFYVVDKSRSRSLGGTGLGLSIVKHIAILHNAVIKIENNNGRGTKFIIVFKKA